MSKHDRGEDGPEDLEGHARALQRELQRFEELVSAARRIPLDRQKTIERAAKATTEAASGQDRVDAALRAFSQAIAALHQRHQANAAALQARGEEIRVRAEQCTALLERWSALGREGRDVNALVQSAAEKQREGMTPEKIREVVELIAGIEARMTALADRARTLGQDAAAVSISDLAEQADALRQQILAAKNKMGLLRQGLSAQLPDASKLN